MAVNLQPRMPGPPAVDYGQGNLLPINGPTGNRDRTPPTPSNVKINVKANGTWILSWSDFRSPHILGDDANPVDSWAIAFLAQSVSNPPSSDPAWLASAQTKATIIAYVPSVGNGQTQTYFQSDTSLGDGYAMIWGVSISGKVGVPAQPLRVLVSTTTGAIPGDPVLSSFTRKTRQIRLIPDNANQVYVFEHNLTWKPPPGITEFGGVTLFGKGINGSTAVITLGSECPWSRSTGSHDFTVTTPIDTGIQDNTASFTNGSNVVNRVTGPLFTAGPVGNSILVFGTTVFGDDYTSVYANFYGAFVNGNQINLLTNFTGANGTYTMRICNLWAYYLNSVSLSGIHRADPTLSTAAAAL